MNKNDSETLTNRELWEMISEQAEGSTGMETDRYDERWGEPSIITYTWEWQSGRGINQQVILANFGEGDIPNDDSASFVGVFRELLLLIISGYFHKVRLLDGENGDEEDRVVSSYEYGEDGAWRKIN